MRSMAVIILLVVSCQPTPPSKTKIVGGAEVTDEKILRCVQRFPY